MKDSWGERVFVDGQWLYGGAARNVRISRNGGLDAICKRVSYQAAHMALEQATRAAERRHVAKVVPFRVARRASAND